MAKDDGGFIIIPTIKDYKWSKDKWCAYKLLLLLNNKYFRTTCWNYTPVYVDRFDFKLCGHLSVHRSRAVNISLFGEKVEAFWYELNLAELKEIFCLTKSEEY